MFYRTNSVKQCDQGQGKKSKPVNDTLAEWLRCTSGSSSTTAASEYAGVVAPVATTSNNNQFCTNLAKHTKTGNTLNLTTKV